MTSTEEENAALRAEVKDLKAAMGLGNHAIRSTFRLPDKLADILGVLLSNQVVTADMLQNRLLLTTEPKVSIHRLRERLKPFGIEIKSANRVGYWLADEHKQHANELIEEQLHPAEATTTSLAAA